MIAKTPKVVLNSKGETLAFLAANDERFPDKYAVKSVWLCAELNRFEADGYVYNSAAQERIMRENNLAVEMAERRQPGLAIRTEGGLLGSLIYNAQNYRREMKLEAGGWIRASQETLAPFAGGKCAAVANGEIGGEIVANVKMIGDRLRLCPLRSRSKAYVEHLDWWVKPVQGEKPADERAADIVTKNPRMLADALVNTAALNS